MDRSERRHFGSKGVWMKSGDTLTADASLDVILGAVRNLPLKYWRPKFYFSGARDEELFELSAGEFPRKPLRRKTHPVFSLKPLADSAGFTVCPCSSKRPAKDSKYQYIRSGCGLKYTGYTLDRNTFIIDTIRFNIPQSVAYHLRFRGEVPQACLVVGGSKDPPDREDGSRPVHDVAGPP